MWGDIPYFNKSQNNVVLDYWWWITCCKGLSVLLPGSWELLWFTGWQKKFGLGLGWGCWIAFSRIFQEIINRMASFFCFSQIPRSSAVYILKQILETQSMLGSQWVFFLKYCPFHCGNALASRMQFKSQRICSTNV